MKEKLKQFNLEELANGKLPKHVTRAIGELTLNIDEFHEWRTSQSPVYLAVLHGKLIIDIRLRLSLKKF